MSMRIREFGQDQDTYLKAYIGKQQSNMIDIWLKMWQKASSPSPHGTKNDNAQHIDGNKNVNF